MTAETELVSLLAQAMEQLLTDLHAGVWNETAFAEACDRLRELATLWHGEERVPKRVVPVILGAVDAVLSAISHYRDAAEQARLQEKALRLDELIQACFVEADDPQEFRLLGEGVEDSDGEF